MNVWKHSQGDYIMLHNDMVDGQMYMLLQIYIVETTGMVLWDECTDRNYHCDN